MGATELSADQILFFNEHGYLVLKNILGAAELLQLQESSLDLIEFGSRQMRSDPDYLYGTGPKSGSQILKRIEYVVDKATPFQSLLAHPSILRTVESLAGSDLVPSWDAMVVKMPSEGISVAWHRDAATECVSTTPVFNVGVYLDNANTQNCVWIVPGSHRWDHETAKAWLSDHHQENTTVETLASDGGVPVELSQGDVLIHNILLIHASPGSECESIRRVIYYEFRTASVEHQFGPHTDEYVALKIRALRACIEGRKACGWISPDEIPFEYSPPAPWNRFQVEPDSRPKLKVRHEEYWRPKTWSPEVTLDIDQTMMCRLREDGTAATYTVKRYIHHDKFSEQRTQIWLWKEATKTTLPFTSNDHSSENPKWSHDGKSIAFTSRRNGCNGLYVMPIDGGEPLIVSDPSVDVADFQWSPDDNWLGYIAPDQRNKKTADTAAEAKDDWR